MAISKNRKKHKQKVNARNRVSMEASKRFAKQYAEMLEAIKKNRENANVPEPPITEIETIT